LEIQFFNANIIRFQEEVIVIIQKRYLLL